MNTTNSNAETMICAVCEDRITEKQTPVYADGYVYHLSCEDGVFSEVFVEV